ncbi:3'-5' RNA helicase YTHDC2-like [Diaphorina citri]|uniref:3'-5' RNA helicase YTHDC2-like n=2 Tax=Diaphorina citri TaxID=121845 RepID=A0A3Q0IJR9_DIACI|nr:3'-5' RNA helicase YTHDC2-like [Diaphorina citri]
MPRRKKKTSELMLVGEDVKIAVNLIIKNFLYNSDSKEYEFPSCYNNVQRAYIHELVKQYGLKSKSRGKGSNRYLTIYKRDGSSIIQNDAVLSLSPSTLQIFNMVLSQCPVTVKDRNELLPLVERDRHLEGNKDQTALSKVAASSKMYNIVPVVPAFQTNPAVLKHKATLPVTQYKNHIMQTVLKNQVLILTGDTGSGKSTQVPQIILEHYRDSKQPARIICAQPRRISAVTVAERVAYEINETVGNTVGYQIRLESRSSGKTVLTYCTNGVLIRTLMGADSASIISTITHLIIDEVHERDRSTDFLLIALKELLLQCRNLRLILMSATVDTDLFSKYFHNCPIISIPGELEYSHTTTTSSLLPPSSPSPPPSTPPPPSNPEVPNTGTPSTSCTSDRHLSAEAKLGLDSYLGSIDEDSVDHALILSLVRHICGHARQDPKAAILIFLPGYEDIVTLQEMLFSDPTCYSQLYVLTLHSQMQTSKQKLVFNAPPEGLRKIILSTNIAETSITINDVVYVIDCGKHKEKTYNSLSGVTSLQSVWVSKACARQRSGRAGRVQPGFCYHLFSRARYQSLPEFQVLQTMDALDPWEDLTELGRHLLDLPISPRYGKMLLVACVLKCLDPILTIVASLAYRDPFLIPMCASEKCAARNQRKALAGGAASDHMALLRAFQAWQDARQRKLQSQFCASRYISAATMEMIVATRSQLLSQLRASGFVKPRGTSDMKDLNTNSEYWPVIKACLVAGLYPNLVRVDRAHSVLRSQKEPKILLHPASILREAHFEPETKASTAHTKAVQGLASDWLIYEEMSRTGNLVHVKTCTVVTPLAVAMFAGPMRLGPDCLIPPDSLTGGHNEDSDSEEDDHASDHSSVLKLDDWLLLRGDDNSIVLTLSMRTISNMALHIALRQFRRNNCLTLMSIAFIKAFYYEARNHLLLKKLRSPHKQLTMPDEMLIVNIVQALIHEDLHYDMRQPTGIGQRPKSTTVDHTYLGDTSGASPPLPPLFRGLHVPSTSKAVPQEPWGPLVRTPALSNISIVKLVHTRTWMFAYDAESSAGSREGKTVYLLFFNPSNCSIHGYARLTSIQSDPNAKVKASHFVGQNLTPPLPIEWIKRSTLSLSTIKNSINTNNQDLYKIVYNDGQELQTMIGDQIKKLWDKPPSSSPYYHGGHYYRNNGGGGAGGGYGNYYGGGGGGGFNGYSGGNRKY